MATIIRIPKGEYYLMTSRKSDRAIDNFSFVSDKNNVIAFSNITVPKELRGKNIRFKIELAK